MRLGIGLGIGSWLGSTGIAATRTVGFISTKTGRGRWQRQSFRGNPYASISAIDVSAGIVASGRTSGAGEFWIHVSASNITATGTSNPSEDLEFRWDFGDPAGTELFTHPANTALGVVNANASQYGPEAAYVYRTPGTYTITLTVRAANGSGGFVTASTSQIVVQHTTRIQLGSPSSGTYTVSVNGTPTAAIAFNATSPARLAAIQAAIGAGKVRYAGGNTIEFIGSLSGTAPTVTVDSSLLVGGTVAVSTVFTGAALANSITVTAFSASNGDWWYDGTSGNDSNDGLDPWGFALSAGAWTAATKVLTSAGAFTAYDHSAATAPSDPKERYNFIRLTGGTGITAGLYQIASKTSNDTIVLATSAGGADSANVASSTGPKLTFAHGATQLATTTTNLRFRVRRGTVATFTALLQIDNGNARRLQAYGTGANPILRYNGTSTTSLARLMTNDDHVCSGIDFDGNGIITTDILNSGSGTIKTARWNYFDGCRAYGLATGGGTLWDFNGAASTDNLVALGLWNCSGIQDLPAIKLGVFCRPIGWYFQLGCAFSVRGTDPVLDHDTYVDNQGSHTLVTLNDFGVVVVANYCINGNSADEIGGVSEYVVFSENDFAFAKRAFDLSDSNNDRTLNGSFAHCVAEGNAIHGLTADGTILYANADTVTIRDNAVWGNTGGRCITPNDGLSGFSIYANLIYHTAGYCLAHAVTSTTPRFVKGNIFIAPEVAPATFVSIIAQTGLTCDGNTYYSPNDAAGQFSVNSVTKTYAQWVALGLDAAGIRTDPGYPLASTGNWLIRA